MVDGNNGSRHHGRIRDVEVVSTENRNNKNRKIRSRNLDDFENKTVGCLWSHCRGIELRGE